MFDKFFKVFVIVAITVFIYLYDPYDALMNISIIFFTTSLIVFLLPLFNGLLKSKKNNNKE